MRIKMKTISILLYYILFSLIGKCKKIMMTLRLEVQYLYLFLGNTSTLEFKTKLFIDY
jgi:hypothetical protein